MKRTLAASSRPSWSGIDAGRRVQVGLQATDIRHFRVSGGGVKRGGAGRPVTRQAGAGFLPFTRILATRWFGASTSAVDPKRLAAA